VLHFITSPNVACQSRFFLTFLLKAEKADFYRQLHLLDENTREVMYMRLTGELSFSEIGDILEKSENWARVTFYRGRQKIAKEWKRDE